MHSRPIVFLHIPKTAGQTIHSELCRVIGSANVSPIRVHTEAAAGSTQLPPGYGLYSGHIDWFELESLFNPYTFTVLRDPQERIASFYFYLLKEAQKLSPTELEQPENYGKKMVLNRSVSDYFFGGNAAWQKFVRDHYDNFYCSYFATRKMRGWSQISHLKPDAMIRLCFENLEKVDRIYSTKNLRPLEADLSALIGCGLEIANSYVNAGSMPRHELRWPKLLELFDRDRDKARLAQFTELDNDLLQQLDVAC